MQDYQSTFPSPSIDLAIKTASQDVANVINSALVHDANNEKEQAVRLLDSALSTEPGNPSLYFLIARCFLDLGNTKFARDAIEKAVHIDKNNPHYFKLQGDIYRACGLPDKAISTYKRSLKLDNRSVVTLNNIGNTCREQLKLVDAKKYLDRALLNDASYVPARYNLALVLIDQKLLPAAEAQLHICTEQAPTLPNTWSTLAKIIVNDNRLDEATTLLETAIKHCPKNTELRFALIDLYERAEDDAQAEPHYKTIDQMDPAIGEHCVAMSVEGMNRLAQQDGQFFANRAAKLNDTHVQNQLFMSSYLAIDDAQTCFQHHLNWSASLDAARDKQLTHHVEANKDRRLRIGYVSPDFYAHAISYFISSILEHHNRADVEVFCYANMHVKPDRVTTRLKSLTDHWREIQDLSDFEAARMIKRDNIDLLIDLSGHTRGSRTSLFVFKPAPLQISYLGYPGSSGLAEMDYWITDHLIHPADALEPSVETKYRLNRCWTTYQLPETLPTLAAKPEGTPTTFGVINHIGKHSRTFISLWAKLLNTNPGSRLLVKSIEFHNGDLRIKVLNQLEELGIDRQRLTLLGQSLNHSEHFSVYNKIDVCLDPFPYNGGTSTADALAMGVPVVTLTGDALKSRMGFSILTASGFPHWVADSPEAYLQIATELGQKGISLEDKQAIRSSFIASEMSDGTALVKELEHAYRNMWSAYCDSQPTVH
jgi:protein O-GlcNAc transferase